MMLGVAVLLAGGLWAGEIHQAAEEGDLAKVQALVKADPSLINAPGEGDKSVVYHAAKGGQVEIAAWLIENGADVDQRTAYNSTAMHAAAFYGQDNVVALLLAHGADFTVANQYGYTPLQSAAAGGHPAIVTRLLDAGADVDQEIVDGTTALLSAASSGNKETFDLLLKRGADINHVTRDNENVLHYAAYGGNVGLVKDLANRGFDLNPPAEQGGSPIVSAMYGGQVEMVEALLELGADVKATNADGNTPLAVLFDAAYRHPELDWPQVASLLIDHGADIDGMDSWGGTPVMRSVWREDLGLVRLLLEKGADPNLVSRRGDSPLMAAVDRGNTFIVDLLLQHGARLGELGLRGETPLHIAAVHGDKGMIDVMLPYTENVDLPDAQGRTPLQLAYKYGHSRVLDLLREHGASDANLSVNVDAPSRLDEPLAEGEAALWYLGHCGWGIRTSNHLLVFDYWSSGGTPTEPCLANGHISPDELGSQNVAAFVSHEHADHYDSSIFTWAEKVPNLTYIFGFKPEEFPEGTRGGWTGQPYEYFAPREARTVDGMQIRTIESNDGGVGFLVEVDGVTIYHAGDHAGWRENERDQFIGEIDYLAEHVDLVDFAFVNVTGCHHHDTVALLTSNMYVAEKLHPKFVIPTHSLNNEQVYAEHADKMRAEGYAGGFILPEFRGDHYVYRRGEVM